MSRILPLVVVLALTPLLASSLQASLRGAVSFADDPTGPGSVSVADLPANSGNVNDTIPTANVTLAPASAGESAGNATTTFTPPPNSEHFRNVTAPAAPSNATAVNGSVAGIPAPPANASAHENAPPGNGSSEASVDEAGYQLYPVEAWLVHYTNLVRAKYGKPRQCVNVKLQNAARHSATVQAKCGHMEHILCDGSTMTSRVNGQGFHYTGVAENVAYTTYCGRTAQECAYTFVRTWVQSPGHFQNMMRNLPMVGMSAAKGANGNYYATQVFGSSMSERCHIAVN